MKPYSQRLISRIKGAMRAGLKPKQLSYLTGIPIDTIRSWRDEDVRATIEADPAVFEDLRLALTKEN